jgi:transcriptional regulator of met regulon
VPAEVHAPHGERGDFIKVTATLSPEVYKLVSDEMLRRKLAKEPNAQLSAILREAVLRYLGPSAA